MKQFKFKELKKLLNLMEDMKWKYVLAILLCAAVEPTYSIGFAFVNKFIFNSIEYKNEKLLLTAILIMVIIFLIYCIVQPITAYHFEGRLYYPIINIHLNLVSSIMKLPRIYFDKNHSGSIMSRLTSDLDNLSTFYREYTYDILSQSLLGLGSFIAIIFIDIRFMPVMILLGIIAIVLNNLFSKKTYELSEKVQLNIAKSNQWFSDMIAGVRTIKTFNADNFSITFPKGKVSAIVGESGKGKSTIFKLILRMYPVSKGELLCCNSKDIAYVPQTPYLFNDSIYENIRYGRLNATESEIIEAAKACNLHDFIMNTTDCYNTKLGDKGINLSGGQRQRIGIARAFLKNSAVILLDEPTSALDTESEALIKEALARLFKDRTVIIISHKTSTIENADNIFVFE